LTPSDNTSESQEIDVRDGGKVSSKNLVIQTGLVVFGAAGTIAYAIGQHLFVQSQENSCALISGNEQDAAWQYYATTSGTKCDTSASEDQIQSAVTLALKVMQQRNELVACFKFDHGGTWSGFLQVAGPGAVIIAGACTTGTYTDMPSVS
jgi:hypothetical protein